MQEQSKREEPLSEELLDRVTGAGCCPSNLRNPGSFHECAECQRSAADFNISNRLSDIFQQAVDTHVKDGNIPLAKSFQETSALEHQRAQETYKRMAAHEHPDFPVTLGEQK